MSSNLSPPSGPGFLPALRSRWWTLLLGLSLMGNLLVGGAIIGHAMRDDDGIGFGPRGHGFGGGRGPSAGPGFVQLLPRSFFAGLPGERRRALMAGLVQNRPDIDALRQASSATAMRLADLIEPSTYDAAAVKALVDDYLSQNAALRDRGAAVLLDLLARLTPEERKLLALELRQPRGYKHN